MFEEIINAAKRVYDSLGPGHSESTYHKAYNYELQALNYSTTCERNIVVTYDDSLGNKHYLNSERIDIFIHANKDKNIGNIVLELKAIKSIGINESNQVKKYMKQLKKDNIDCSHGLVINFPTSKETIEHIIFEQSSEQNPL